MEKLRPGICSKCGDKDRITKNKLGTLYCVLCNNKRLKSEKDNKMAVSGNSKRKPQTKVKDIIGNTDGHIKIQREIDVFHEIWEEREHVSFIDGSYLGDDLNVCFFSHILSKALNKYPKFKLYKKNIVLMTFDQHFKFDHQPRSHIADLPEWQKLFALEEELKEEYKLL